MIEKLTEPEANSIGAELTAELDRIKKLYPTFSFCLIAGRVTDDKHQEVFLAASDETCPVCVYEAFGKMIEENDIRHSGEEDEKEIEVIADPSLFAKSSIFGRMGSD